MPRKKMKDHRVDSPFVVRFVQKTVFDYHKDGRTKAEARKRAIAEAFPQGLPDNVTVSVATRKAYQTMQASGMIALFGVDDHDD